MSTLRDCIKKAGKLLSPANGEALLAAQRERVGDGYSAEAAAESAIQSALEEARAQLAEVRAQLPAPAPRNEDPQATERQAVAARIGRVLASQPGSEGDTLIEQFMAAVRADPIANAAMRDYIERLNAEVKARGAQVEAIKQAYERVLNRFNSIARIVQRQHGLSDEFFGARPSTKGTRRIVEKLVFGDKLTSEADFTQGLHEMKDILGATLVIRTRTQAEAVRSDLLRVMGLDASDRARVSPKLNLAKADPRQGGYRDDKLRAQVMPNRWGEVIITTPGIYAVKTHGVGHAAYEIRRTIDAMKTLVDVPASLVALQKKADLLAGLDYEAAWVTDSALFSAPASDSTSDQNSASLTSRATGPSGIRPGLPSGPTSLNRSLPVGTQIANTDLSPSSSVPAMKLEPGGALNRSFITPTTTGEGAVRQPPKITTANIAEYAGNVDVSAIRGREGDIWKAFDRSKLDPQAGRLVAVDSLISTKNELLDPKFLAGKKNDPRQNAANAMGWSLDGDPRNTKGPREPLDVTANEDGTFTIIDGNATAQAAMLAGWKTLPVNVRPAQQLNSATATEPDLFGNLLADYAQKLPPKAKRNKAAAKKVVEAEIPGLPPAAFDDLFSLAQAAPLTESTSVRSGDQPKSSADENQSRPSQTAAAGENGGRAFTERESDDFGPLFGYAGAAPAASDGVGSQRDPDRNVEGAPPPQSDNAGDRQDEQPAGGLGNTDGSLSGALPGGGNAGSGRTDARRAAEDRRLARITRSHALGVNEQNHRITAEDAIAEGGAKTRIRANVAAIRLLKDLQSSGRNATPEEKRILAKYVGWGALPQVFDHRGQNVSDQIDSLTDYIETAERQAKSYPSISYYTERVATLKAEREALERWDRQWGEGYRALKELLTPEEWEAARNSTENAHYTDRSVISAMWDAVRAMGFQGGRVLEPAGGVGHFFGLMPEEMMRASELFGVELDTISGGIFKALYPDSQVQVAGFESARLPDNTFDLAISNVPFSEIGPFDQVHAKAKLNLHNYFFAKALDKVRPGGLVAFITTSHTLESSPRQRAYLAELGDFVGAVRLPNNAFSANAGTEVTTDIVFMRKRDGIGASPFAQPWLQKEKVGEDTIPDPEGGTKTVPITVNEYFARHPEMVLGRHSMNGSMYAGPSKNGQYTVFPAEGAQLSEQLPAALRQLPAAYTESGESSSAIISTTETARDGAFTLREGDVGIQQGGTWKPLAEAAPEFFGEGKVKYRRKASDFIRLRDAYRAHLSLMARPLATAAEITRSMQELNRLYDSFSGQWGTFENGRHRELKSDPDFYLLKGLEIVETKIDPETGEQTEHVVKADVLKKRTIFPSLAPTKAENALDALRISQSWKGHLDLEFMGELLGDEAEAVRRQLLDGGLAFENPRTGLLETKEQYLSGKVREKLRQAEAAAQSNPDYARNVEALRAVQPPPVPVRHVTPKLGGGWVPPALLKAFLRHAGFGEVDVTYTQVGDFDKWAIKSRGYSPAAYNGGGFTGLELLSHALDQKTPQAYDSDEKGKRTFNPGRTANAQAALKRLTDEWEKFAKGDSEVTITIDGKEVTAPVAQITADAFNETFNGTVPRVYDGSHLTLPGSAPFLLGPADQGGLRQHQKNGIWRAVQEGVAFLAHGVGAGKTRELIAIAMEWKRLGLAKKPMLVVHNPTLNQFANETRKIYPGARVLIATKEDLQKENRRAFAARVASGDWDLVVIAHSSFNLIDDQPEVISKFIGEQKADVEAALRERLNETGDKNAEKSKDPTVKQLVKILRALEARLLKASQLKNKDSAIFFQDLGVDGLLIDEAHLFKKVPFVTKMGQVAGLDMGSSARASNLLMRLSDVRAKNNGRNVVLATGTPITNTLAEVWNMIRLTSPATLKEFGVSTFDQFSAAFGQVVDSLEMNPAGKWVPRKRFARFVNGTGLAAFIRSVMDVQLNLELGQPKIANNGLSAVVTPRTPSLGAYMKHLEGLYESWQKLDGEEKQLFSAIPLVISGVAKAATMDMRLVDPTAPDDPNSKANRALAKVVEFYRQEEERKGVQIIFADQYRKISTEYLDKFAGGSFSATAEDEDTIVDEETDTGDDTAPGEFNLYHDLRDKLIARGVPADEIAIATDYDTDDKRAVLFAKANAGRIRILIGSTQKLGVGVNVQERLYALHHLDTPWTPADLEQRIGRGWRSGNLYAKWNIPIQNLAYGVENTMDAGRYQVIETKSRFVKQAMEGKAGFEFEDPAGGMVDAAAELKAQFTGDPRVMEKVTLENQIRSLEVQLDAFEGRRRQFQTELEVARSGERSSRQQLAQNQTKAARLDAVAKQGIDPALLDEIDARIDIAKDEIVADGALQQEKARNVWSRILGEGISVTVYASGILDAKNQVATRVNAVLALDGEPYIDKGITSSGASGLTELLTRAAARGQSFVTGSEAHVAAAVRAQETAKTEIEREFPDAAELKAKRARLHAIDQSLQGKNTEPTPLAEGRGPRGELPPAGSLASSAATDPNQLEFEQITPEELAAADRAIENATRAERVREALPIADKIARQFRIPGFEPADVRQEARSALITAAQQYDDAKGAFAPYAGMVIRNRLRDLFNREVRRVRTQGISADAPATEKGGSILDHRPAEDNTRTGAEMAETRRLLTEAMAELPPRLRAILDAQANGKNGEEIAREMGVSRERVRQLAGNAMAFVRAKLKKAGVKRLEGDGVLASASATIETPEFKKWFGDSKVVDEQGKPLVVFHGTTETKYVEGETESGSTSARSKIEALAQKHGIGSWLDVPSILERWVRQGNSDVAEDAKTARELLPLAKHKAEKGKRELAFNVFNLPSGQLELGVHVGTADQASRFGDVFPLYVKIERPLRLSDLGTWHYQNVMREARRAGVKISESEYTKVFDAFDNNAALRELLMAKGYDGIVYENEAEGSGDSWIAFHPTQIKSATGNKGTFDPKNPSILASATAADQNDRMAPDSGAAPQSKGDPQSGPVEAELPVGQYEQVVKAKAEKERSAAITNAPTSDGTKGTFSADLDHSYYAEEILYPMAVPRGVQWEPFRRTKWGSYYGVLTDPETGDSWKVAIKDHEQTRYGMGTPDYTLIVGKEWSPEKVAAAARKVENWIWSKFNDWPDDAALREESNAASGEAGGVVESSRADKPQMAAERTEPGVRSQPQPTASATEGNPNPPRAEGGALSSSPAQLIRDYAQSDWELLAENLADSTDTFAFARNSGRLSYELQDVVQHFMDFAREKHANSSIADAFKAFRAESDATPSQLAKVRTLLAEAGLLSNRPLASSPAEDELAIAELMAELARDVPTKAIGQRMSEGSAEQPGARTIGNPSLANPAGPDDASRGVMNAVDEARKESMERETHEQWRTEAVAMIDRDRAGVLRDLLAKAQAGEGLHNAVQVKAAQILVNDLIQTAIADRSNTQAMRDAQTLAWSYREGGTEQARAFAARRDPFKKPADRYREFLAGAIFTPDPAIREKLKNTWSPAAKQREIASLNKQLAEARAQLQNAKVAGTPIPADLQRRVSQLNQALGTATQQKDRAELLNSALTERMKKIEAEFAKMGVTLDDVFAGEAYLRLRGQKIDNNIFDAANYSAIKRRALSLIKKGWSNDYIAKKTGLSASQVDAFYNEHVAALRARLEKLGDDALDPDKLDALNLASASAANLASASGGLTAAERAAKIEQMIAAMGYAKNEQRQQRTRRAPAARRNPKPATPTPQPAPTTSEATEPGQTPAYPDATGRPRDDFGNRNLGLGENPAANPPGATLPDSTGRANPYDFAGDDAAPPVFDVSDPVQVAQLVRVIQTVDGNGFDMAFEFWVNAVLSGPLTQGANITGNSANLVWDFTVKRFTEAALNTMIGSAEGAQFGEFRHIARAVNPAISRAWKNALRTWTAGSPMFTNDVLNQQLDLVGDFDKTGSVRASIPGKKGQVIRIPGRLLMATDDFFKTLVGTMEATAQAYRMAKAAGLSGPALESSIRGQVNLPGSAAWIAAVRKADELTFQEEHKGRVAGTTLRAVGGLRKIPGMRYQIPFVRTPFNIFLQGLRQSPVISHVNLLARFAHAGFYKLKDGRPIAQSYPQPEMIKHLAETLIATTAAALLYGAAAGDEDDEEKPILITGSVPYKDAGINALNQRTGNEPFTIRVGNVSIPYGRIEPAATIIGTTVDFIAARKRAKRDAATLDVLGTILRNVGQQTEHKTFLRGIADLMEVMKGERDDIVANYTANFLASWIPNLLRQPLRELDPVYRDRRGGFAERLASNIIPQTAEPKIDVYGEPSMRPGLAAWRTLIPINVRQAPEVARVDRLLTNWNQAHPDEDYAPIPLNRTLRLAGQKEARQLTGPELRDYSIRSGKLAAQILRPMALNIEKPTEEDLKRVKAAFSTARQITRRQMFGARAQEIESP